MNKIVSKFLLAGDKFSPEMHLRQPGFTYSACEPLTKNKERIQNLKKHEIRNIFIKTNYIKLAFSMTWLMEISKIYLQEQLLIKYYVIKYLTLLKNQNMMNIYQKGLASMVYKFFEKKNSSDGAKSDIISNQNQELAKELHKTIIKKSEKRKVYYDK